MRITGTQPSPKTAVSTVPVPAVTTAVTSAVTETTEVGTTVGETGVSSQQAWFVAVICLVVLVPVSLCVAVCLWRLCKRHRPFSWLAAKLKTLGDAYDIEKLTNRTGSTVCALLTDARTLHCLFALITLVLS